MAKAREGKQHPLENSFALSGEYICARTNLLCPECGREKNPSIILLVARANRQAVVVRSISAIRLRWMREVETVMSLSEKVQPREFCLEMMISH